MPGLFGHERDRSPAQESIYTGDTIKPAAPNEKLKPHTFNVVDRMPSTFRNEFIAFSGEFVGTFLFLFMAFCGTQVANAPQSASGDKSTTLANGPDPLQLLFISLAFGMSLLVSFAQTFLSQLDD